MMKRIFYISIICLLTACAEETAVHQNDHHQNDLAQVAATPVALTSSKSDSMQQHTEPKNAFERLVDSDYLMGKFDPAKHADFVPVAKKHADRAGMYLRKETYEAFQRMDSAARADGIRLTIRSATRNFDAQKGIWEGKWTGQRLLEGKENASVKYPDAKDRALNILEWSSMPGTSRHHWGTDMDLNAFVNSYFEKGEGLKVYEWLTTHAGTFGFCQPYSEKNETRPHGYNEEKWHWSYQPVAAQLLAQYKAELSNDDIAGFKGAEIAKDIQVVQRYVLGVHQSCY